MTRSCRRLTRPLLIGAVATGGVLLAGGPASADVNVSPSEAVAGDAASVTFLVDNLRPGAHTTQVEVLLPADLPVAEVYPMTVPDWAPRIVYRAADRPLPGIHGSDLTTATSAVVWTRAADAAAPPKVEQLRLEMGPMPTAPRFAFTVVQTYSDGTVQRWSGPSATGPGTVLTLAPAGSAGSAGSAGDSAGHGQHGGPAQGSGPGDQVADQAATVPVAASTASDGGNGGFDRVTVVVVGGVSLALAGALMLATRPPRRRPGQDAVPDHDHAALHTDGDGTDRAEGAEAEATT